MGVDLYANTVIGFKIPLAELETITRTKKRGCGHPELKGALFCPQCGANMWEEGTESDLYDVSEKIGQVHGSDFEMVHNEGDEYCYIGYVVSTDGDDVNRIDIDKIPEIADKSSRILDILGYGGDRIFAIWNIMRFC